MTVEIPVQHKKGRVYLIVGYDSPISSNMREAYDQNLWIEQPTRTCTRKAFQDSAKMSFKAITDNKNTALVQYLHCFSALECISINKVYWLTIRFNLLSATDLGACLSSYVPNNQSDSGGGDGKVPPKVTRPSFRAHLACALMDIASIEFFKTMKSDDVKVVMYLKMLATARRLLAPETSSLSLMMQGISMRLQQVFTRVHDGKLGLQTSPILQKITPERRQNLQTYKPCCKHRQIAATSSVLNHILHSVHVNSYLKGKRSLGTLSVTKDLANPSPTERENKAIYKQCMIALRFSLRATYYHLCLQNYGYALSLLKLALHIYDCFFGTKTTNSHKKKPPTAASPQHQQHQQQQGGAAAAAHRADDESVILKSSIIFNILQLIRNVYQSVLQHVNHSKYTLKQFHEEYETSLNSGFMKFFVLFQCFHPNNGVAINWITTGIKTVDDMERKRDDVISCLASLQRPPPQVQNGNKKMINNYNNAILPNKNLISTLTRIETFISSGDLFEPIKPEVAMLTIDPFKLVCSYSDMKLPYFTKRSLQKVCDTIRRSILKRQGKAECVDLIPDMARFAFLQRSLYEFYDKKTDLRAPPSRSPPSSSGGNYDARRDCLVVARDAYYDIYEMFKRMYGVKSQEPARYLSEKHMVQFEAVRWNWLETCRTLVCMISNNRAEWLTSVDRNELVKTFTQFRVGGINSYTHIFDFCSQIKPFSNLVYAEIMLIYTDFISGDQSSVHDEALIEATCLNCVSFVRKHCLHSKAGIEIEMLCRFKLMHICVEKLKRAIASQPFEISAALKNTASEIAACYFSFNKVIDRIDEKGSDFEPCTMVSDAQVFCEDLRFAIECFMVYRPCDKQPYLDSNRELLVPLPPLPPGTRYMDEEVFEFKELQVSKNESGSFKQYCINWEDVWDRFLAAYELFDKYST